MSKIVFHRPATRLSDAEKPLKKKKEDPLKKRLRGLPLPKTFDWNKVDLNAPGRSKQADKAKANQRVIGNKFASKTEVDQILKFGIAIWDYLGWAHCTDPFMIAFRRAVNKPILKQKLTELHGEMVMAFYFRLNGIGPLYSWSAGTGVDGIAIREENRVGFFGIYEAKGPNAELTISDGKGWQMSDKWVAHTMPTTVRLAARINESHAGNQESQDVTINGLLGLYYKSKSAKKLLKSYKESFYGKEATAQCGFDVLFDRIRWVRCNTKPFLIEADPMPQTNNNRIGGVRIGILIPLIYGEAILNSDYSGDKPGEVQRFGIYVP